MVKKLSQITAATFPLAGGDRLVGVSAANADLLYPNPGNNIINVKDFGAVGNGIADDTTAIQSAIDAAFGTAASPHGTTNAKLNKPLYFPEGTYKVTSTLLFTGVYGGQVFGAGIFATVITYAGSVSGTTIQSLIQTNGMAYTSFSGMQLQISGTATVAFNLYWDGIVAVSLTGNTFSNMYFEGSGSPNGSTGFLIGAVGSNASPTQTIMGSENSFFNCSFSNWSHAGFKTLGANALNNNLFQVSCAGCGIGIYASIGGIAFVSGGSFANGTTGSNIDITVNQNPCHIAGCRTETNNFLTCTTWAHISGIDHSNANAGNFVDVSSSGIVLIDTCRLGTLAVLAGSSASQLLIRGSVLTNASALSSYTGKIAEYNPGPLTFSTLPTAATSWKGVRLVITDSSVTTFGTNAAGGGGTTVPVYCDGTNWKVG